jgi:hypothetical protein
MNETFPPGPNFGPDDKADTSDSGAPQPIPLSETVYRAIAAINRAAPPSAAQPAVAAPPTAPTSPAPLPEALGDSKGGRLASQARALAESITTSFVDRITAETQRNGGVLNLQDIHDLEGEFEKKTDALQITLENALDDFARAREQSHFSLTRENPFDRLFVAEIHDLFVSDEEAPRSFHKVSRRILPGFFKAMNLMMTPDLIEKFNERTRTIVKRVSEGREDDFTWEDVFKEADAQELCLEAQVAIAFHFKELDKRSQWFVNLINENLPPLDPSFSPAAKDWRVTPETFRELLGELFAKLRGTLASEMGEIKITLRHGAGTCGVLINVLEQFDD